MGSMNTTMILLVGLTMSIIVGPQGSGMRAGLIGGLIRQSPVALAQTEKSIETKKEQPAEPEPNNTPAEPIEPRPSDRLKEKPPRDFVPSEKIPADQAVDFPTDI